MYSIGIVLLYISMCKCRKNRCLKITECALPGALTCLKICLIAEPPFTKYMFIIIIIIIINIIIIISSSSSSSTYIYIYIYTNPFVNSRCHTRRVSRAGLEVEKSAASCTVCKFDKTVLSGRRAAHKQ